MNELCCSVGDVDAETIVSKQVDVAGGRRNDVRGFIVNENTKKTYQDNQRCNRPFMNIPPKDQWNMLQTKKEGKMVVRAPLSKGKHTRIPGDTIICVVQNEVAAPS